LESKGEDACQNMVLTNLVLF